MEKNKMVKIGLAVFCSVIVSFFVFSFIDFNASGPADETISESNQQDGSGSGENNGNDGSSGEADLINNVENNVNGDEAEISNDIKNNADGENTKVNNSIDNNVNNSNNNKIDNNVTNNIGVNVNVNVSNDISNNVSGNQSNSEGSSNGGQSNGGDQGNGNSNGSNNGQSNGDEASNGEGVVWGVDSASLTTEEMLQCVTGNFGSPAVWGRYLGDKEGVSEGLTPEEVERLHSNDIKVLVIWNHFTDATGYENGQNEARLAIQKAQELGIPEGVAIFADIEPNYPVDSEFIRGWFEVVNQSQYKSGVYGVFDEERDLFNAYQEAGQSNAELLKNNYVWTAHPNVGITTEANAPGYKPIAPDNSLIGGWQYGLDAQTCNIDTNWFDRNVLDVVW